MAKIYKIALLGLLFILYRGSFINAQSTFTIESPASLSGENLALVGLWGNNDDGTMLTGEIVLGFDDQAIDDGNGNLGLITDGCETLVNDVSGKIVLLDRSFTCLSSDAFDNAPDAIGMLICPNEDYDFFVQPRGAALDKNIPVFTLNRETCDNIKMALSTGEVVVGTYNVVCQAEIPDNTVWGANGEGRFEEEGKGWQSDNEFGWVHDPKGYVGRGAFNTNFGYARTQTSCSGAYIFDSSFGDNNGSGATPGTGDCPSTDFNGVALPVAQRCMSTLTSPIIDLSSSSAESFVLVFDQAVRTWQSTFAILVSRDGGMTWDTTQLNTELPRNSNHIAETVRFPLCGITNASQLMIGFASVGTYYYWAIDDVYIVAEEIVDVQGMENFYAIPPSFRTPVSQLDVHPFLIDVQNFGNLAAQGVSVEANIRDINLNSLYSTSQDYGSIDPCFLDENKVFSDSYDMKDLAVGTYRTDYFVTLDNNTEGEPSRVGSAWQVTDSTFMKILPESDAGLAYLGNFGNGSFSNVSHGNHYYIVNDGYAATTVRAGVTSQEVDDGVPYIAEIEIELYEWFDDNGDNNCDPGERKLIAKAFKEVEYDDPDARDFEVTLENVIDPGKPIALSAGEGYMILAHYSALDPLNYSLRFPAQNTTANRAFDYGATTLATREQGFAKYGTFFGSSNDFGNIENRSFFWAPNFTSHLTLGITKLITSTEDINNDISAGLYPIPASDFINLDLALETTNKQVNVSLTDAQGKVVLSQNYDHVKVETLKLNVSNLSTGTYLANIRTDYGFTTKKVIIVR